MKYGHARYPGDLPKELPVFIHPVFDDPLKHLSLDAKTGLLIDKTPRGKLCIDLLGLNREGLAKERKKIYLSVLAFIRTSIDSIRQRDLKNLSDNSAIIESYKQGVRLTRAGQVALKDQRAAMKELKRLSDAL